MFVPLFQAPPRLSALQLWPLLFFVCASPPGVTMPLDSMAEVPSAPPMGLNRLTPLPWQDAASQSLPSSWSSVPDPLAFPPNYAPRPVDQMPEKQNEERQRITVPQRRR